MVEHNTASMIACIGWGSLVWHPGALPCIGEWQKDGPEIPVEFARESGATRRRRGTRVTLVICANTPRVTTLWVPLNTQSIQTARTQLALREYPQASDEWTSENIGFWDAPSDEMFGLEAQTIARWAAAKKLVGVVWTSLSFKFNGENRMPSGDEVVSFLQSLQGEAKAKAKEYVCRTPVQIKTPYRALIEQKFGWLPAPVWGLATSSRLV